MFNKSTFFAALFVLLGFTLRFASATPPACVLACVNEQPEVHNYEEICKANVADMASCLKSKCKEDFYDDAVTNYKASCKEANFNVVMPTATPTPSTTKTSSSSTKTSSSTATPSSGSNSTDSSSSPDSDSDSEAQDENSASTVYYNSMLALIAVFAAAVAL